MRCRLPTILLCRRLRVFFLLFACVFLTSLTSELLRSEPQAGGSSSAITRRFSQAQIQEAMALGDERFEELVRQRGIDFGVDEAFLKMLEQEGASTRKLAVLRKFLEPANRDHSEQSSSGDVKKTEKGRLHIQCAPLECEVEINGRPRGTTRDGNMTLELDPADYTVDLKHNPDYIGLQARKVTIQAEHATELVQELRPTIETELHYGQQLLLESRGALGLAEASGPGLSEASALVAEGEAVVFDGKQQQTNFNVEIRLKLPNLVFIQLRQGGRIVGSEAFGFKSDERKGTIPPQIENAILLFRERQPESLLALLMLPSSSAMASTPTVRGSQLTKLRATRPSEEIEVLFGIDALPTSVAITSAVPNTPPVKVVYDQYKPMENGKTLYPREFAVGLVSGSVAFKFRTVKSAPKLTENNFTAKTINF